MLKAKGLEYEANGDGEAVLLIHGALVADALLPLTREAALADRYRLIRYRRRGHGAAIRCRLRSASSNKRRTPWRS